MAGLTTLWTAQAQGDVVGVLGLRPATACGTEVMGGVFPGPDRAAVAAALIRAALVHEPRLVAYGEEAFFPAEAWQSAGLVLLSAYTEMSGPLPAQPAEGCPRATGSFRWTGSAPYETGWWRSRPTWISRVIRWSPHRPCCLGWPGRTTGWAGLPTTLVAIRWGWCGPGRTGTNSRWAILGCTGPHRPSGLRRALVLACCGAARPQGATRLVLQSWGETAAEREGDERLGLTLNSYTPIYGSV